MTTATTLSCDVLVIGAGPAGSACAQMLARAGFDVLLADRHEFPRDKVCGDALIPDAHRALARLGVLEQVLARAARATQVDCFAPRGGRMAVPAQLAVLPRRELDDILRLAALAAGARWLAPARFEVPLLDAGRQVAGARLRQDEKGALEVRARWTVLATGADVPALLAAGMCQRRAASGMALRAHVHSQVQAARIVQLQVVWHRALRGGYGWIFPAGDGRFNVGVGIMHATRGPRAGGSNLRELFETFTQEHPPARQLMQDAALLGDFKGAPLRCSLSGAAVARPGLLVAGEAAGSTYLFTGEGIGKAMESGMLAAQALAAGRLLDDAAACAHYEGAVAALKPRFAAYEVANRFNEHPWLVDLVAWRARRSAAFAARLAGVLDESEDPARLASVGGLARLLWPLG